jgi:hypothetical protein
VIHLKPFFPGIQTVAAQGVVHLRYEAPEIAQNVFQ